MDDYCIAIVVIAMVVPSGRLFACIVGWVYTVHCPYSIVVISYSSSLYSILVYMVDDGTGDINGRNGNGNTSINGTHDMDYHQNDRQ